MLKYFIIFLLVTGVVPVQMYNADDNMRSAHSIIQPINSKFEKKDRAGPAFQNVKVTKKSNVFIINGKARSRNQEIFYTVEDGHDELISARIIRLDAAYPNWSPFKIKLKISKNKLPTNGTLIIYLFERDKDDKQIINALPIILYKQSGS